MDNISGGMKSLCEDITAAHGDRKRSRKVHKEMAEGLTKGLKEHREELIKNVSSLREDFGKKEKEIRADLAEASRIWNKMNKTLEAKKSKNE